MENARKYVPSPSEFKKPIGTGSNKRPNHLRLVETQPAGEKFNIVTAPTLEVKPSSSSTEKEFKPYTPTEPEIIIPPDEIDLELEKLTTWPPHPNLELANSVLLEKTIAKSALYNLEKYEDPDYSPDNRPNDDLILTEKNKLEEKITSLESALGLIIEPALKEAEEISIFAENTREKLLHYRSDKKNERRPIINQNVDQKIRSRLVLHLNKSPNTVEGQIGKKIEYFLNSEIDNMMADISQLKAEHLKSKKIEQPIQPVRTITQPQLYSIDKQRSGSSFGNKISDTFKKISGFFKKAA